ncbi:MAG: DUF1634 domain-containing protein [Gemmatimonadaceae bacterium]
MTDTGPNGRWSDHAVEQLIGRLLQIGVLIAAAVTIAGGALLLFQHGGAIPTFSVFRGEPERLTSLTAIVRGAMALQSDAIVQCGLLLLIATPVARVAFTLVAFVLQRDRTYIAITALVLVLLLYGLLFGTA